MTVTELERRPATADAVGGTVRALAAYGLPGTMTRLPDRPLDVAQWSALAGRVSRERLSGLLLAAIEDGALPVTPQQHAYAVAFGTRAIARCLQLEGLLLRTERILAGAGVPLRVLKGSATAHLDYPDARLRPFIDVDLLVRSADFDTAAAALAEAGLSRTYPQPRPGFDRRFGKGASFRATDGTAVDLHRTFVMGPYGLRVRLDDLWVDPQPFEVSGRALLAMPVEARLLHACYHAVLGDWPRRLLPHRDIAQVLLAGDYDADLVRVLARRWRAEALLATGLAGAWERLGLRAEVPLSRWARGYTIPPAEARAIAVYSHERHNFAAKSLAAVRSIPGVREKLDFLRALALPDRDYVLHRHSSPRQRLLHGLREVRARGSRGPRE